MITSRYRAAGGFSPNWIFSTAAPPVVNFLTMRAILQKFHIHRLAIVAEDLLHENEVKNENRAEVENLERLAASLGVDVLGTMWIMDANVMGNTINSTSWVHHPTYKDLLAKRPQVLFFMASPRQEVYENVSGPAQPEPLRQFGR